MILNYKFKEIVCEDIDLYEDIHSNYFLKIKDEESFLMCSVGKDSFKEWLEGKKTLWTILSKQNYIYKGVDDFDLIEIKTLINKRSYYESKRA